MKLRLLLLNFLFFAFINALVAAPPTYIQTKDGVIVFTDPGGRIFQHAILTSKAPIVPQWALGFWQSRERYKTQDEIFTVVDEFRKRKIPIDNSLFK